MGNTCKKLSCEDLIETLKPIIAQIVQEEILLLEQKMNVNKQTEDLVHNMINDVLKED